MMKGFQEVRSQKWLRSKIKSSIWSELLDVSKVVCAGGAPLKETHKISFYKNGLVVIVRQFYVYYCCH
jgi:hypothetical protein